MKDTKKKSAKKTETSKKDKKRPVTNEEIAKAALPKNKQEIIKIYAQKDGDTGSPEVQVALLTYKINTLFQHLEINKKDNHSRRGLLKVIAKRRRILNYLQKLDDKRYKQLIKKLGLKK